MLRLFYAAGALGALAAVVLLARRLPKVVVALVVLLALGLLAWAVTTGQTRPALPTATCQPTAGAVSPAVIDAGHLVADANHITSAFLALAAELSQGGLQASWQATHAAVVTAQRDYSAAQARLASAQGPVPCGYREFLAAYGDLVRAAGAAVADGLALATGNGAAARDLVAQLGAMSTALDSIATNLDRLLGVGP